MTLESAPQRRCRARQIAFLSAYRVSLVIAAAAQAARIGRRRHYHWMEQDPEYRQAFDLIRLEKAGELEEEAVRRALEGSLVPVFYKGVQCGTRRHYSDRLLMFLLRAWLPKIYGHTRSPRLRAKPPGSSLRSELKPADSEERTTRIFVGILPEATGADPVCRPCAEAAEKWLARPSHDPAAFSCPCQTGPIPAEYAHPNRPGQCGVRIRETPDFTGVFYNRPQQAV